MPAEILYSPWVLGLLGLLIGSFLNVVVHRLPQMMERDWRAQSAELLGLPDPDAGKPPVGLSRPRSRCPSCGHAIRWYENIPLASWLALGGRCSACKTRISARYPLIELATGALFAAIAWRFGAQWTTLLWCGFAAALIALAAIDWDTTYLPEEINGPLLWAGLIAACLGWTPLRIGDALWGAVAGYLSLWLIATAWKTVRGEIGMGPGDFKLLAALGAWLGLKMLLPIVLLASLIGALVGIGMKLAKSLREGRYVPFGPFLAGAGLVVMFAGERRVLGWLGWSWLA